MHVSHSYVADFFEGTFRSLSKMNAGPSSFVTSRLIRYVAKPAITNSSQVIFNGGG